MSESFELPFPVEDGGDLPEYWHEGHDEADADVKAGRLSYFDDEDEFDRALDEAAAHPYAS